MATRKHVFIASPLFEIARVLVRLDHVAGVIVNANHCIATELAMGSRFFG